MYYVCVSLGRVFKQFAFKEFKRSVLSREGGPSLNSNKQLKEFRELKKSKELKEFKIGPAPDLKLLKPILNSSNSSNCLSLQRV